MNQRTSFEPIRPSINGPLCTANDEATSDSSMSPCTLILTFRRPDVYVQLLSRRRGNQFRERTCAFDLVPWVAFSSRIGSEAMFSVRRRSRCSSFTIPWRIRLCSSTESLKQPETTHRCPMLMVYLQTTNQNFCWMVDAEGCRRFLFKITKVLVSLSVNHHHVRSTYGAPRVYGDGFGGNDTLGLEKKPAALIDFAVKCSLRRLVGKAQRKSTTFQFDA